MQKAWPGMNRDIKTTVKRCKVCIELLPSKSSEPLLHHEVPTRPWQKTGSDIFHYGNKSYLIIADYYSLWPEVHLLLSATSDTVIDALKQTFSNNGIPEKLLLENGLQYRSRKLQKFMTAWNVQHTTSSPRYPRSNGLAESMVKSVKKTIKKCVRSKQDIYMGLLILRNSPLNCGSSPAQLLMNRKLQDNLPKFYMSRPLKP